MTDIFCEIIKKDKQAYIVYESQNVLAFLDTKPYSEGHALVVPKQHFDDIESLDQKTSDELLLAVQYIVKKLRKNFNYTDISFSCDNGEKSQHVRHLHIHVYPSYKQDIIVNDSYFIDTLQKFKN